MPCSKSPTSPGYSMMHAFPNTGLGGFVQSPIGVSFSGMSPWESALPVPSMRMVLPASSVAILVALPQEVNVRFSFLQFSFGARGPS